MPNFKIQARLNPDFGAEKEALDVYHQYIKKGATTRRIIAEALIALGGNPLPERTTMQDLRKEMRTMQKQMASQHQELLALFARLQELDLTSYRNDNGRSMEDEIGGMVSKGFLSNLKSASNLATFDDED